MRFQCDRRWKNIVYSSNNNNYYYYVHYIYTTLYTQIFNTLYRHVSMLRIATELRIPSDVLDTIQCVPVCVWCVSVYYII